MPRIPRILMAYDGSPFANAALDDLANAGIGPKAEVRVLAVADVWAPAITPAAFAGGEADMWYAAGLSGLQKQSQSVRKEAKTLAEKGAARLAKLFPEWKISAVSALDAPAQAILNAAAKWKPSLIALGSQGHSALDRMLLGSVSHKVLAHASCSVRVGRKPKGRKRSGPPRVLLAVDGSRDGDAVVEAVARRAWENGATFRVTVIADYRLSLVLNFQAGIPTRRGGWKTVARRIAEKAQATLQASGLKADSTVREGDPRGEIVREAARFRADSVFVGSRGHGALQRFLLGSTSLSVVERAPCTVEVIR